MLVDEAREFESSLRERLAELESATEQEIKRTDEEEQQASVQRRLAAKAWEAREIERQSRKRSDSRTVKPFWKKAGDLFAGGGESTESNNPSEPKEKVAGQNSKTAR
jgi:hypothetical protein